MILGIDFLHITMGRLALSLAASLATMAGTVFAISPLNSGNSAEGTRYRDNTGAEFAMYTADGGAVEGGLHDSAGLLTVPGPMVRPGMGAPEHLRLWYRSVWGSAPGSKDKPPLVVLHGMPGYGSLNLLPLQELAVLAGRPVGVPRQRRRAGGRGATRLRERGCLTGWLAGWRASGDSVC